MDRSSFCVEELRTLVAEISANNLVPYEELPKYDFFISQVIEYLNDNFTEEKYTNNIIQNYIKSEIISKPVHGKKRGYTKLHLIQLVLISYMRPILTTEEIRKVFRVAFNKIDDRSDDIISWETAYKIFSKMYQDEEAILENPCVMVEHIEEIISELKLSPEDEERIKLFLTVMTLATQASIIKKLLQRLISDYNEGQDEN